MISKLERVLAFRYLKPKKKEGFLKVISIFSFTGIALGVAILIIVMSVMNGFRSELVDKIIGFNAHAVVKPYENPINSNIFSNKKLRLISKKLVLSNSGEGVIINRDYTKGILLRGYGQKSFKRLKLAQNKNFLGNKELRRKHISIGKELSYLLNVDIGDKILLMSPAGVKTIVGLLPKQEAYIVDSIFESGLSDFDQNIAFLNIYDLENFFSLDKKDRYLEVYLKKPEKIDENKIKLSNIFPNENIYTWADLNQSLFSALKVERNVMFIILSLIIIVAAFNIISGLTILVKNKTRDIAILKSIGVKNNSIMKIFFMIGFLIGSIATLFGILLGILFSIYIENIREFISKTFNVSLFPEEIYFFSQMPSEINLKSILVISFFSLLITTIATIFPSLSAAKLDPIKALKYE